jgi:surfeit locus 1 family protein
MGLRRWIVLAAALAVTLITARLGWWQLDRAAQKQALQATLDARLKAAPLTGPDLARATDAAVEQHHRRVVVSGHWLPRHTVRLDNRQMNGRPGFHVLTPLRLDDGRAVLVQRGWQARDFLDRARTAPVPTPEGLQSVTGRIAPPPSRLLELGRSDGSDPSDGSDRSGHKDKPAGVDGAIRQNIDLAAFAQETGLRLLPLTVLQTEAPAVADGLQRDWPAPGTGVAKHQGYAFQWFGLSALTVVFYVWSQLIQPRRRRVQG